MSNEQELGTGLPQGWPWSVLLFALTAFTTTIAGVQWVGRNAFELDNLHFGVEYSIAILFVLASHEFGHYFAARRHRVQTTLPFFIPFPPFQFLLNFGTLGAVIRTKSPIATRKAMFDIGVAGPLAGFVACLGVLIYALLTLPGPEYLLSIHPDFNFSLTEIPNSQGLSLEFGHTILYGFLVNVFTDSSTQFVPPMSEIYHYPYLCVGWFGLFVTAMNLIPIGQFDGGHIIYTMFGGKQRTVARIFFAGLMVLGLPSVIDFALQSGFSALTNEPQSQFVPFAEYSWSGWFLWAMVSFFLVRLDHPPISDETPLDKTRILVGWLAMAIFVISFSFVPFSVSI